MSIHTGHGLGCAGAAGAGGVGLGGLQDRINEHHDKVVKHVQEHAGAVHDRIQGHVDSIHDAVQSHLGHSGGEAISGAPLDLVFPTWTPPVVSDQGFDLQAIPLPGGVVMNVIMLAALACLVVILASAMVKTVVVKCSG